MAKPQTTEQKAHRRAWLAAYRKRPEVQEKRRRDGAAYYERTKEAKSEYARQYNSDEENKARRLARRRADSMTPEGAAALGWQGAVQRVSNPPRAYIGVQLLMAREEFMEWAIPAYAEFLQNNPGVPPTLDRIDPKGHYVIGNLRVVSKVVNSRRGRVDRGGGPPGTWYCPRCQQYLPLGSFGRGVVGPGVQCYCRSCRAEYDRKRFADRRTLRR